MGCLDSIECVSNGQGFCLETDETLRENLERSDSSESEDPRRRGSVSSHCSGAQLVEQKSYFRGANSAHNGTSVLFSLPQ